MESMTKLLPAALETLVDIQVASGRTSVRGLA